jgi:hypothetical protein
MMAWMMNLLKVFTFGILNMKLINVTFFIPIHITINN